MFESGKAALKRIVIERLRRRDAARRATLSGGFGGLPPELWGANIDAQGRMCVEGLSAASLVEQFGSPLYVVNLPWLRKTHDAFLQPFRASYPHIGLATSYKTNPVPAVLRALHDYGTHAEVISEFELWLAGHLGLPGERIIVNGPGKGPSMITRAVEMGVKCINIDGPGEIEQIAAVAQRCGRRQHVGIRLVTSVGWSSQFGLSIASGAAMAAFEQVARTPALVPIGVHLHIGTGLKSVDLYLRAISEVLDFADALKQRCGIELQLFDLGGGYGVPTVRGLDIWDTRMLAQGYPAREAIPSDTPTPSDYATRITRLFTERMQGRSPPQIILEPGRAITSGAQTLLLSVVAVKEAGGVRKLILDGGKNITLPLGWETHKIFPAQKLDQPFTTRTDLYGPLCHPGDIVALHQTLPMLGQGDLLAVMDAGAYFVPNQMNFSNPRPAIVTVENGQARLVRQRESFADIVRLDDI